MTSSNRVENWHTYALWYMAVLCQVSSRYLFSLESYSNIPYFTTYCNLRNVEITFDDVIEFRPNLQHTRALIRGRCVPSFKSRSVLDQKLFKHSVVYKSVFYGIFYSVVYKLYFTECMLQAVSCKISNIPYFTNLYFTE